MTMKSLFFARSVQVSVWCFFTFALLARLGSKLWWAGQRIAVCAVMIAAFQSSLFAATPDKIQASISKGRAFLLKQRLDGAYGAMATLALLKSGADHDTPQIHAIVQSVMEHIPEQGYVPGDHHIYQASVELMLLESLDPKLYRSKIEAIAKYIMQSQLDNGAWFYPNRSEPGRGDTSITQYAILGLWAAQRANIDIPTATWEKAAQWHIDEQREDGGFAYHPFDESAAGGIEEKKGRNTMTGAGTSSMLIIRRMLFGGSANDVFAQATNNTKKFGVIDRFNDESSATKRNPKIRVGAIDDSLKGSIRWLDRNIGAKNPTRDEFYTYDLYCIERVATFLDVEEIGGHRWYEEGSDELILKQTADGSWNDKCSPIGSTSLALLFLSRATRQLIKPAPKANLLGAGLQIGGRGLPGNLAAVQSKDGVISSRKIVGPVDELLIALERSSDAKVQEAQAAIVETVQLDQREKLIGELPRLRKLVTDSRPEVRRTVFWALGRSGEINVVPLLINGLKESDVEIAREASFALCILSRKPEGCGITIDPTADAQMGLTADSSDEERRLALQKWATESTNRWTEWYQKIQPYDERDDRSSLKKK